MGESCCAAKSQFKGLFKEKAAKYHEVVPVAVLGLHDLGGIDASGGHVEDILGFTGRKVRVCGEFSQRAHWVGGVKVSVYHDIRAV